METADTLAPVPVTNALCTVLVPHVHGKPMTAKAQQEIFGWLREETWHDWSARIAQARDGNEKAALVAEQLAQDRLVAACASAFCAGVAVMFGIPPTVLDVKTSDGRPVDRTTIDFRDLSFVLRPPFNPRGLATPPPRLADHDAPAPEA